MEYQSFQYIKNYACVEFGEYNEKLILIVAIDIEMLVVFQHIYKTPSLNKVKFWIRKLGSSKMNFYQINFKYETEYYFKNLYSLYRGSSGVAGYHFICMSAYKK